MKIQFLLFMSTKYWNSRRWGRSQANWSFQSWSFLLFTNYIQLWNSIIDLFTHKCFIHWRYIKNPWIDVSLLINLPKFYTCCTIYFYWESINENTLNAYNEIQKKFLQSMCTHIFQMNINKFQRRSSLTRNTCV